MKARAFDQIKRIRANYTAARPQPLAIAANITGLCNLKCSFCEKSETVAGKNMDEATLRRLIDVGVKFDVPLFLSGGEPFLNKGLWAAFEYCREVGKKVRIASNGTRLGNLGDDQFRLLEDAVEIISISVDSGIAEEHDEIRGKAGTFAKIIEYIGEPRRRNPVELFGVLRVDLSNVTSLLRLARETRCTMAFQPLIFESNYPFLDAVEMKDGLSEEMRANAPGLRRRLREYSDLARSMEVVTNLGYLEEFLEEYYSCAGTNRFFATEVMNEFKCAVPFQEITVDEDGIITPCVFLQGTHSIFEDDIYESWLKSATEYRERLLGGEGFPECRSCSCHFRANYKYNLLAHPVANRAQVGWWLLSQTRKRGVHALAALVNPSEAERKRPIAGSSA